MNTIGLKIPTGGRQSSWLFTNMAEEEPGSATKQLQLSGGRVHSDILLNFFERKKYFK